MDQRLSRKDRLHATLEAVMKEGRKHGREGWVTQSMIAHHMDIRPGCYMLGLLQELHEQGKLWRGTGEHHNGIAKICFRIPDDGIPEEGWPF